MRTPFSLLFLACGALGAQAPAPAPRPVKVDIPAQAAQEPLSPRHQALIAAAQERPEPVFHGPERLGIRPGTPFLHALALTGERPMTFSAQGLPEGLSLDPRTGIVTGSLEHPGETKVTFTARNAKGQARRRVTLACGETLALTPPMGWNSYDAFGDAVTEGEVLANAALLKERLQPLGYDTVVVDFRWYDPLADGIRNQDPEGVLIDAQGLPVPAPNRFPSSAGGQGFKPLAERIHAMGLKFGIHMMRGIPRKTVAQDLPIPGSPFRASQAVLPGTSPIRACPWNRDMWGVDGASEAGKAWYRALYGRFAQWGVDFVKVDDLAYIDGVYSAAEVEAVAAALKAGGRSVVLSLSPGEAPMDCAEHLKAHANLWRAQNDFWDNWPATDHNLTRLLAWGVHAGPGHWPDGDMLPFGHVCIRNCDVGHERWTRLRRDEQLTVMSAWALASSPLMLGMHLPDNDPWTWALIGNPEVLAVNQDSAGRGVRKVEAPGLSCEAWAKDLSDGSRAVGLFNRGPESRTVEVAWKDLGLIPGQVRDLWLRKAMDPAPVLKALLPPHGCLMLKGAR